MNDTTRSAVIASLAVLAVAFAAATLDSTVVPERSPGNTEGAGPGEGGLLPIPRSGPTPVETIQIPFLREVLALLLVIVTLAFVVYVIRNWRDALGALLVVLALVGLVFVLSQLLPFPAPSDPPRLPPGDGSVLGGGGGGDRADPSPPSAPSLVLLFVLVLTLVGSVAALLGATTDRDADSPGESSATETDVSAVGRAAGRAADRLEAEPDVDNGVYRAWREMTALLDVDDPETSTPGEFAAAAVDAGLGREDVAELTRLFEDVRYGSQRPSEEHERRAIGVFRRIESRYAEDDP
jgi:hypothetical protein